MRKKKAVKKMIQTVRRDEQWTVSFGKLNPGPGHPGSIRNLFRVMGEKPPFEARGKVSQFLKAKGFSKNGVYMAHDSMGFARYIGWGSIFSRLREHIKAHPLELKYFSFYAVEEKKHEREIETLLIRAAGPLAEFNSKKKRTTISAGNIMDYEAGTRFLERHRKKGKKKKAGRKRSG